MSKIYFEMNDKERQLRHIGETIEYAACMFGEGLSGTGEYSIPTKEVIELQSKISDQLINVQALIEKLLKAVEEEEEEEGESSLEMFPVKEYEDVKELTDYTVYGITETSSEQGDNKGYNFIFRSELPGGGYVFKNLLVSADGGLYISDIY